ncbi:MAG: hypothetical protein JJU36_10000, partial [Phycisphaeraceae bacterium]|nr:hypothetical protein [Phycisphaeraceae bacterium]
MPITINENIQSREVAEGLWAELAYTIRGTADEAAALSSLKVTAPTSVHGLIRHQVTVEPVHIDSDNPDHGIWTGTARYEPYQNQQPQTGEWVFNFDTGGGTHHITQSLATIAAHAPAGQAAPDFQGAIGVNQDNVEGVDITVPVYSFSETHYLPDSMVTNAYKGTLFHLTGKVNAGTFKGLAAGECLFLGASGSRRVPESDPSGGNWEITFRFAGSPNATGLMVGGIGPIDKKGWEYLWVRYQDAEDGAAKALVKRPV